MAKVPVQVREVLARALSRSRDPIVVNSFGRSGSTVLTDGIVSSASRAGEFASWHAIRGEAWKLDTDRIRRYRVYKSHDYPSEGLRSDARVLYVFGDPIDATYSLLDRAEKRGQSWIDRHADHLRVPRFAADELFHRDALGVAKHLTAWLTQTHSTVGFVRYESLWTHQDSISGFVGFPVQLPPRRERASKTHLGSAEMRAAYADAIEIVQSLPDWSVRGA